MNAYKRFLTVTSGRVYRLQDAKEYSYKPDDFTATSLLRFILHDGTTLLIQGDKVSHITLYEFFSFRLWLRSRFGRGNDGKQKAVRDCHGK